MHDGGEEEFVLPELLRVWKVLSCVEDACCVDFKIRVQELEYR